MKTSAGGTPEICTKCGKKVFAWQYTEQNKLICLSCFRDLENEGVKLNTRGIEHENRI